MLKIMLMISRNDYPRMKSKLWGRKSTSHILTEARFPFVFCHMSRVMCSMTKFQSRVDCLVDGDLIRSYWS